jgi:hypothetical protein
MPGMFNGFNGRNKYQGKPCVRCFSNERYVKDNRCVACRQEYKRKPEVRVRIKELETIRCQKPEYREAKILKYKKYRNSDKGILKQAQYYESLWGRSSYLFLRAKNGPKKKTYQLQSHGR